MNNDPADVLTCLDAQREAIAAEGALRSADAVGPLLSDVAQLRNFADLNAVFQSKLRWVLGHDGCRYAGIREVTGDGNCFLRGFLFQLLSGVAANPAAAARLKDYIAAAKTPLVAQFGDYVEDFVEVTEETLDTILAGGPNVSAFVLKSVSEKGTADYLIYFLRMLLSWFLRGHAAAISPFIAATDTDTLSPAAQHKILNAIADGSDQGIVDAYCEALVEPVGVESDQFHIIALSALFNVKIEVLYVDNNVMEATPHGMRCQVHAFDPDTLASMAGDVKGVLPQPLFDGDAVGISMLYRPGHYEILYRK